MAWFAAALGAVSSLFGGSKGILGGVSSAMDYKAQKETEQIRQKGELEQVKEGGRQQRENSRYEMQLASDMDEYQRKRKRGAFKNYGFAAPTDPYAQTAMQGYEQVWKPEDTKLTLSAPPNGTTPSTTQSLAAPLPPLPPRR